MKNIYILSLVFIFVAFGCKNTDNPEIDNQHNTSENIPPGTLEVSDIIGIVGFWGANDIDKFTIVVYVPGTIDSQIVGIVDDLPAEFREEGLRVVFSGTYDESSDSAVAMVGGQSIYSLVVDSIDLQ